MKKLLVLAAMAALAGCETMAPGFAFPTGAAAAAGPSVAGGTSTTVTTLGAPVSTEQELLEADRALGALAAQKGVDVALAETVDPIDGFVLTDQGALKGGASIVSVMGAQAAAGPLFWQAEQAFIARSGDMGMTTGSYVQVLPGQEAAQGRYVTVWRKDAEGRWRVLADVPVAKKPPPKAVVAATTTKKKK